MSEQELNQLVAANIVRFMERKGLTQAQVAEYMGVSEAAVSMWCRGKKMPRMNKIDQLCLLFGCSRSELLADQVDSSQSADSKDALLQQIYDKSKILFDAADDATPEEIIKAAGYLEGLKSQRG